jgi:hypothetical protein
MGLLLGGGVGAGVGVGGALGSLFAGSPAGVANVNSAEAALNPAPFEEVARKVYDVLGDNPKSVAEC